MIKFTHLEEISLDRLDHCLFCLEYFAMIFKHHKEFKFKLIYV